MGEEDGEGVRERERGGWGRRGGEREGGRVLEGGREGEREGGDYLGPSSVVQHSRPGIALCSPARGPEGLGTRAPVPPGHGASLSL